jgi:phosphomannomutase / phosphoglucomutase
MHPPGHIFRQYDIRGHAADDLHDELVTAIGRAFATLVGQRPSGKALTVAVARDCRLSSDRLFEAFCDGLTSAGVHVVDVGVGPSPLLYFAAHELQTSGAVMITGSHNPPEDNGFKLMRGTATLFGDDILAIRRIIESRRYQEGGGSLRIEDISEGYLEALRNALRIAVGSRDLKVVVDAGNGAAGPLALRAFAALGIAVEPLFCDMDGRFPHHHPDPTVEDNLASLKERVVASGAMMGVAFDGDGDRIGVIDDRGDVVWGDKLMILFSRAVLAENPGATILGEVKCSQTLYDDIAARGGRGIVSATGHSLIKKRMKDEGALLAGEMSGHIFFADRYFGFDDAIYAALRLVELVLATGKLPSELLADVPKMAVTPEIRVDCPDELKFEVVERVKAHFAARREVVDIDGARIVFDDGAWGLCRASNTGPVLVLRFEAATIEQRDAVRAEVEAVVAEARAALGS